MLTATADRSTPESTDGSIRGWRTSRVPSDSYVVFRAAFGILVAVGQIRFLARGWVEEFYLAPEHHLTYAGFNWIRPLPAVLMYGLVVGLALLGVLIALGIRARTAAALFAVGFAYCELIDAALYLNHYWFITVAALLLAILPGPSAGVVPSATIWALRTQLAVVYIFAGVAKLNPDWLLRAEPLGTWLAARTDRPFVGPLLDEPVVAYAFSVAGAVFDLTIVGLLLWKRSRILAYLVLVGFHVATAALFQIGMFPWVMIMLTPIFFDPRWPARVLDPIRARWPSRAAESGPPHVRRPIVAVLAALLVINIAVPLRHVAAEGNVRWNDDGYLGSWRVMLTERSTDVVFSVGDPATGRIQPVDTSSVLTEWQAASALVRADLILATAHLIADDQRRRLGRDVEVYADAVVAWNGRLRTQWIDPTVDLAAVSRWAPASDYVMDEPTDG